MYFQFTREMIKFAYFTADGRMAAESYHQAYIYQEFIRAHHICFHYYPALPDSLWRVWRKCSEDSAILSRILRRLIRIILIPAWRLFQFVNAFSCGYDGFIMGRC